MDYDIEKDICIIGAGLSGLTSAKWALEMGYTVKIYDKNNRLGGCWISKAYENVRLQSNKDSYSFSDYPMSEKYSDYPTRKQIIEYFSNYSDNNNINKHIEYNSTVLSTRYIVKNRNKSKKTINPIIQPENIIWKVTIQKNDKVKIKYFRYLIVCSGFYDKAYIPELFLKNNTNNFNGIINHIEKFSYNGTESFNQLKNKNIVIIGNGPSGIDSACEAIENGAKSVTIVYRSERWFTIRNLKIGLINYNSKTIINRFLFLLVKLLPKDLMYIGICFVASMIYLLLGVNNILKLPDVVINRYNINVNDKIYPHLISGKIQYICGNTRKIETDSILIDLIDENKKTIGEKNIKTDYIIVCTGYTQGIHFMEMKNIPRLYKNIIHPKCPNCGFIGLVASYNWAQTSDLQARWFIDFISNPKKYKKILLNDMYKYIDNFDKSQRKINVEFHDLAYTMFEYCDELSKDIDIEHSLFFKLSPDYWFGNVKYDYWSNKYKKLILNFL